MCSNLVHLMSHRTRSTFRVTWFPIPCRQQMIEIRTHTKTRQTRAVYISFENTNAHTTPTRTLANASTCGRMRAALISIYILFFFSISIINNATFNCLCALAECTRVERIQCHHQHRIIAASLRQSCHASCSTSPYAIACAAFLWPYVCVCVYMWAFWCSHANTITKHKHTRTKWEIFISNSFVRAANEHETSDNNNTRTPSVFLCSARNGLHWGTSHLPPPPTARAAHKKWAIIKPNKQTLGARESRRERQTETRASWRACTRAYGYREC